LKARERKHQTQTSHLTPIKQLKQSRQNKGIVNFSFEVIGNVFISKHIANYSNEAGGVVEKNYFDSW
jgi:hypothetical protein